MLTEKDYCDYDTSITLSELGFPLKRMKVKNFIDGQFSDSIVTVLLYEAQKWLREEKDVIIVVCPYTYDIINKTHTWTCEIWFGDNLEYEIHNFKSYEKALSKGIKEAIKILKEEII